MLRSGGEGHFLRYSGSKRGHKSALGIFHFARKVYRIFTYFGNICTFVHYCLQTFSKNCEILTEVYKIFGFGM